MHVCERDVRIGRRCNCYSKQTPALAPPPLPHTHTRRVCVALRGCPGTDVGGATAAESQPGAIVHGIDNLITNASNKNTADMFVRWQPTGAWLVRLQLSCGDVAASMHPLQEWDTVVANRGWGNL